MCTSGRCGERSDTMRRMVILGLALALTLAACGSSGEKAAVDPAVQRDADLYQIDQIERTWHKASSKHDVDLMMTLWAPDATFTIGTESLTGKAQIRDFFAHKAGP